MKIIDIRNSVVSFLQIIPENKEENIKNKLLNKTKLLRGTSFLQVDENKTPKLQCNCKFIKSSEQFLEKNLANLKKQNTPENNTPQNTEFIEMKVKENLIEKHNTKINEEKKNGNIKLI